MKLYNHISEYNDMLYDSRPVSINEYISDKYNVIHNKLYNDALNKYLDSLISKYINEEFLSECRNIFNDINNIDNIINDKNYITNILSNLGLQNRFLYNIYNLISFNNEKSDDELLDDIKILFIKEYKRSHNIIEIKDTEYWMSSKIIIITNKPPYKKSLIDLKPYWNYYQRMNEYDISDLKITNENILDSEVYELDYVKGLASIESKVNDIQYKIPFKYLDENTKVSSKLKLTNTFIENI